MNSLNPIFLHFSKNKGVHLSKFINSIYQYYKIAKKTYKKMTANSFRLRKRCSNISKKSRKKANLDQKSKVKLFGFTLHS